MDNLGLQSRGKVGPGMTAAKLDVEVSLHVLSLLPWGSLIDQGADATMDSGMRSADGDVDRDVPVRDACSQKRHNETMNSNSTIDIYLLAVSLVSSVYGKATRTIHIGIEYEYTTVPV